MRTGNTPPSVDATLRKLERPGALFASDEVRVVADALKAALEYIADLEASLNFRPNADSLINPAPLDAAAERGLRSKKPKLVLYPRSGLISSLPENDGECDA